MEKTNDVVFDLFMMAYFMGMSETTNSTTFDKFPLKNEKQNIMVKQLRDRMEIVERIIPKKKEDNMENMSDKEFNDLVEKGERAMERVKVMLNIKEESDKEIKK